MSEAMKQLVQRLQSYNDPLKIPADEIKRARKELSREEYFDGQKLKMLRKKRGISQKEVAQIVGMSTTTLGATERGENTPYPSQTKLIADYFGVAPDFFVSVRYPKTWWEQHGKPHDSKTFKQLERKVKNRKFRKGVYDSYKISQ
jgi:transcriptional regulator with XRE-family HTH domain